MFHVNPTTGDVGACRAEKGGCPFGSPEEHHTTVEGATAAAEQQLAAQYDFDSFRKASPGAGEASSLIVFSTKSGTKYRLHRETPQGDTWTAERLNTDGSRELHRNMLIASLQPGGGAHLRHVSDPEVYIRTSRVATFDSDALSPDLRAAEGLEAPDLEGETADAAQLARAAGGRPDDIPYVRTPGRASLFVMTTSSGEVYRAHVQDASRAQDSLHTLERFDEAGVRSVYKDIRILSMDIAEPAAFADAQGRMFRTEELIGFDSDNLTPHLRELENLEYR